MTTRHIRSTDCPACTPSGLTLDDLPVGTRVRVQHRQDSIGVVDELYPRSGLVGIKFEYVTSSGKKTRGHGLNLPSQCVIVTPPAPRETLLKIMGEARNGWMSDFYVVSASIAKAVVSGAITDADLDAYAANGSTEGMSQELARKAGLGWYGDDDASRFEANAEAVEIAVECLRNVISGEASIHGEGWSFYDEDLTDNDVTLQQVCDALRANTSLQQAAQLVVDADEYHRSH